MSRLLPALLVLAVASPPAGQRHHLDTPAAAAAPAPADAAGEQSHQPQGDPMVPGARRRFTPAEKLLQADFRLDLIRRNGTQREIYERYLPKLGLQPMLDVLEERNPFCHAEAHELGQALYRLRRDAGVAISECSMGCTGGCLHGVLKEAYGDRKVEEITAKLEGICSQLPMATPGSCAHGMGHALMMMSGRDVARSVAACGGFGRPVLDYYCQTGVFMELFDRQAEWKEQRAADLFYPCSTASGYPAACWRYLGPWLLESKRNDRAKVIELCRSLPRAQRLACMHGYGFSTFDIIARRPDFLGSICPSEPIDDATVCIEGLVEFLWSYDPALAKQSCDSLRGRPAEVCRDAAREGFYRLEKPSLPLYLTPDAGDSAKAPASPSASAQPASDGTR
jgi:hypothetical protein